MENFTVEINGIEVNAKYTKDNIEQIFIPLLKKLTKMQQDKKKRILVMMAAPPGTGKSTLCEYLKYLSDNVDGIHPIQIIGMDGFHRYQDYLISHTTVRDGVEIPMVKIKGAPITFDLDKLKERIIKVASGEKCGWPIYNRMTHNPKEDAIVVDGDIVILEGNYLLLDIDGWNELKQYADYTIRIFAKETDLRQRLIERKVNSGADYEDAVDFVEKSDLYNARTCLQHSLKGDMNLRLNSDDSYSLEHEKHRYSSEPDIPDCGCIYG